MTEIWTGRRPVLAMLGHESVPAVAPSNPALRGMTDAFQRFTALARDRFEWNETAFDGARDTARAHPDRDYSLAFLAVVEFGQLVLRSPEEALAALAGRPEPIAPGAAFVAEVLRGGAS